MPHQCVHCGKIYPKASKELLEGCSKCKGHFFLYIKEEDLENKKEQILNLPKEEKKEVEKEIRDVAGIKKEDSPVILDLESIRSIGSGKFEIDLVNLFNQKRPLIYKMGEGKYIVDLSSAFGKNKKE
jgi:predicted  nucleic acid-binding Zn-ribbon protein